MNKSVSAGSISTRIKKAKFKPRTKPRFFGSIGHCKSDLREYNKHLLNVFMAKAKVDSKPPKFPAEKYWKFSSLQTEQAILKERNRQNKFLVQQINIINRQGGKINTVNEFANNTSTKWNLKKQELDRINKDNLVFYERIMNAEANYKIKDHAEHWAYMLKKMPYFAKYPIIINAAKTKDERVRECPSISMNLHGLLNGKQRPRCFFDFDFATGQPLGRIVFELYNDVVPKTVANFLWLVNGADPKQLTYKYSYINRIYLGKYCILGANRPGQKDTSLFGDSFEPENFKLLHSRPGVLSMFCCNNKVKSQFCVTFSHRTELNGKNVVFGKMITGASVLQRINGLSSRHGKPILDVVVGKCQEIIRTPKKK